MRRNSGVDASVPKSSAGIGRKGLTVAAALCLVCSCSEPAWRLVTGDWVGTAKGVQVQLRLTEAPATDPTFGRYEDVTGTGSLITSTGDSLPFTVEGYRISGPTGLFMIFRAPVGGPGYGNFWGQLADNGALIGSIDGTTIGMIGPFAGGQFGQGDHFDSTLSHAHLAALPSRRAQDVSQHRHC
jgi:hypothetical protein